MLSQRKETIKAAEVNSVWLARMCGVAGLQAITHFITDVEGYLHAHGTGIGGVPVEVPVGYGDKESMFAPEPAPKSAKMLKLEAQLAEAQQEALKLQSAAEAN